MLLPRSAPRKGSVARPSRFRNAGRKRCRQAVPGRWTITPQVRWLGGVRVRGQVRLQDRRHCWHDTLRRPRGEPDPTARAGYAKQLRRRGFGWHGKHMADTRERYIEGLSGKREISRVALPPFDVIDFHDVCILMGVLQQRGRDVQASDPGATSGRGHGDGPVPQARSRPRSADPTSAKPTRRAAIERKSGRYRDRIRSSSSATPVRLST